MFNLGQNYDLLCNMIIRPPRFIYDISDLGPKFFSAGGKPAQRTDFELVNGRGLILHCSHFEPISNWERPMPCVIYLHGNGGCRIEALDIVHTLLPLDVSVLALDFAGSGLSEGEYVSLGSWEQWDVATVVQYLRETNRCSTIGLWGRSMGAVTAILYSMRDPSIAAMILDSPFCSLQKIAEDLVLNIETLQKMPRFTKFAVNLAMKPIRSTIKKKAKFDIKSLEVLDLVPNCFIPALFVHGRDDNFVLPVHSELLYNKYSGDKNRILVDGNHNTMRPNFFMDSAVIFFNNTLHNGSAHNAHTVSPLPELPLSTPQTQAQVQLQQFQDIFHPLHRNHQHQHHHHPHLHHHSDAHAQNSAQQTQQTLNTQTAEVQKQDSQEQAQSVSLESVNVFVDPLSQENNWVSAGQMNGSVVIDDMVIGNTVIIDGRPVVLDGNSDPDAFFPNTTPSISPSSSQTHSTTATRDSDPVETTQMPTANGIRTHEPTSFTNETTTSLTPTNPSPAVDTTISEQVETVASHDSVVAAAPNGVHETAPAVQTHMVNHASQDHQVLNPAMETTSPIQKQYTEPVATHEDQTHKETHETKPYYEQTSALAESLDSQPLKLPQEHATEAIPEEIEALPEDN